MKLARMIAVGMVGSLPAGLWASPVPAQGGAPSQSDIAGQLLPKVMQKTRGLPTPGVAPAPASNPAVRRASTHPAAQPEAGPRPRQPHTRAASVQPAPGAAEQPKVSLDTIQFEFNSVQLLPQSIETLQNLGKALNDQLRDQKSFLLEGYTDAKGGRQYNLELSERRAGAVKDYLVKEMGVAPDRLRATGKGESDLALPKKPYAAQNRRVVVVNLGG